MRRIFIPTAVALAMAAFTQFVLAADLPVKAPPVFPAVTAPSWTGFYVGGNVGFGWGDTTDDTVQLPTSLQFSANPFSQDMSPNGILGGGQIGYNYQSGAYVWGIEVDIQASNLDDTSTLSGLPTSTGTIIPAWNNVDTQKLKWFGTVRGRVGWLPTNSWLLYVTGGLIYGKAETSSLTTYTPAPPFTYAGSSSDIRTGWTVGGGVEWMFMPRWSLKVEGLYFDLGSEDYIANPLAQNPPYQLSHSFSHLTGGIVRGGVNYHF